VSLHLRGPIQLSQFAVYHRRAGTSKRDASPEPEAEPEALEEPLHARDFPALARHGKRHAHEKRDNVVFTVTETLYQTTTHVHTSHTTSSSSPPPAAPVAPVAPAPNTPVSSYDFVRDSYYNAATGENDNIMFLNHLGGTAGSGVWDLCFGNSLSFAAANGVSAAGSPQTLGNVLIPSNNEIILFSAAPCGDCGYVRPGTPAYRGFSTGGDTVFLLKFEMPRDSGAGFNVDMSAAWFLNAQIPRTLQYGNAACSCWTTGCGEFDAFEILSTGSNFLTSTLHSWQGTGTQYGGGGCADYIQRPLASYMTAAVVFSAATGQIKVITLPDSVNFDAGFMNADYQSWCGISGSQVNIAG
jgi:Cell wall protein YJL171C/Tos1, C-terminal